MRKFLLFCLLVSASSSFAQSLWETIPESSISTVGERRIIPSKYQTMWLNVNTLQSFLTNVPERFTAAANLNSALPILTLPTPEGRMSRFQLAESPVMAPELQAQYPDIRCYTGYGIDDPTAFLKCDLTPHGFHAMVLSTEHGTYFVDPYSQGDRQNYVVYYKKDYPRPAGKEFVCETAPGTPKELDPLQTPDQGSCQLRRYRLALACTGEYATFQGGTVALALAAMNTSMNRVNGVYEKELAVTMLLVANDNLLVYTNSTTDPYSNTNSSSLTNQNQTNCDAVIGSANYDIGHVFSTAGGGLACLGCVCVAGQKAGAETGTSAPTGDAFDIDYVAHEMGHQFAGNHTFNGTAGSCGGGNRNIGTAFETGSGSTIMAYAGICTGQDVQAHSDAYFHGGSLAEMGSFIIGTGASCGTVINTSNNPPTANAGASYTIPKSTPFILTASGTDPNGNSLTYDWEQMNNTSSTQPPVSTATGGPNFRSFTATSSPSRTFPAIDAVISNTTPTWEVLPSVGRTLSFRVNVRDNAAAYGCTEMSNMTVTVNGSAGPFLVTAPNNAGITWTNAAQTITWDVANTTAAPVSCANVNILLSTDGGNSFGTTLAANTPNDGSEIISVPLGVLGQTSCRVKIESVGNIFFDMSNNNFAIAAVLPVELTSFQVRLVGENTALLTWATASETNNLGFDIEMKREGDNDFQSAGFVAGKGTTTTKNSYQFQVPNLTEGTWYFRLKQLDLDGKTTYSPQQSVQVRDNFSVKVFPNPVQNDLNLVLFQKNDGAVSFELLNQLGQRFDLLSAQPLDKGFSTLHLSVASLPNGVYYYTCHGESGTSTGKIVVERR